MGGDEDGGGGSGWRGHLGAEAEGDEDQEELDAEGVDEELADIEGANAGAALPGVYPQAVQFIAARLDRGGGPHAFL